MGRVTKTKAVELVLDYNLYPRTKVDDVNVRSLVDALAAGATIPAVVADKKTKRVVDGFHRTVATIRADGPDATVAVEWRDYEDDAALYADAVRLNAAHGRRLSPYDHARIMVKAAELGRTVAEVSEWLRIPADRLERRTSSAIVAVRNGQAARRVPLKRTMRHLRDREITREQEEANARAGGMNQRFYVRQVLLFIESGALDLENPGLMQDLARLRDALGGLEIPEVTETA